MEEQYRQTHRAVWPELIEAASRCGVRNHSCFVTDEPCSCTSNRRIFRGTYARLAEEPVKQRWDQSMGKILEPGTLPFEEVFPWIEHPDGITKQIVFLMSDRTKSIQSALQREV